MPEGFEIEEIDVLGAIAYSEQRDQMYDFTYENIISNWGQIYTGKLSNIESILDFKGKKIAVLQNDIYYKNLSQLVKIRYRVPVHRSIRL